ncbi:Hypothetical protein PHPALM_13023 [Phytophthora palmivora]|uniref:Uncharacterized protein n=1 Tax=Phytophthora palmivora TaxID=4796 RepID=A0A2P4XY94_9STRA|nr:Hypothetical protein PHPALM_13023 [Phytophthora palmivora]
MTGRVELVASRDPKAIDAVMTPPRKLRKLTSPPKINQSRPVYPVRVGPPLPSFDDWSDEEYEDAKPVRPWSQTA